MSRHVMTPARKAALRKAQLASAKKRRRGARTNRAKSFVRRHRTALIATSAVAGSAAVAGYAVHSYSTKVLKGGPKRPSRSGPSIPSRVAVHGTQTRSIVRTGKKQGNPTPYLKYYVDKPGPRPIDLAKETPYSRNLIALHRQRRPVIAEGRHPGPKHLAKYGQASAPVLGKARRMGKFYGESGAED